MSTKQLVIEGDDLGKIADAAALLHERFPAGLDVRVEDTPVDGWTPETARHFAARLNEDALAALTAVVEGDGFADDDALRGPDGESLRGKITGPMTRHINKLIKLGVLPPDTTRPLWGNYEDGRASFHRTKGLHMDPELVRVFAEALRPSEPELHENPEQDTEMTEAVLGVLRRHIPEYREGAGIEHLVVVVRSDDEAAAERNFYVLTGTREDAVMLLRRAVGALAPTL